MDSAFIVCLQFKSEINEIRQLVYSLEQQNTILGKNKT